LHHCEQSGGFNQFLLKKQTVAAQTITWCKRRRLANYKTCSCLQAMYKECIPWVGTSSPLTCCRKSVMLRGLTSSAIHTSSRNSKINLPFLQLHQTFFGNCYLLNCNL
jgi:hypothetical protein